MYEKERELDVVGGTMETRLVSGGREGSVVERCLHYLEGGRRHDLYVQRKVESC